MSRRRRWALRLVGGAAAVGIWYVTKGVLAFCGVLDPDAPWVFPVSLVLIPAACLLINVKVIGTEKK